MTIQVAIMNGYGLAMASDRHVFRGGEARSSGQDTKLHRLRGSVPAAMMASGPFAVFGRPVSRLALRLERAIADCGEDCGPEALAEAALRCLDVPLEGPPRDSDADLLTEVAGQVIDQAARFADSHAVGLERLLDELERIPGCRDHAAVEARGRAAWDAAAPALSEALGGERPHAAAAMRAAPELYGRAVAGALARDWRPSQGRRNDELLLTVGLCCPDTGVPAMISLRLWRGLGQRLHAVSRLERDYEVSWQAGRTVMAAQGSGRGVIEAMVDGLDEDHWAAMPPERRLALRPALESRWLRAHTRLGASSPRELGLAASGLVRGAEVVGYLTQQAEATVAPVDCLVLTHREVFDLPLAA